LTRVLANVAHFVAVAKTFLFTDDTAEKVL